MHRANLPSRSNILSILFACLSSLMPLPALAHSPAQEMADAAKNFLAALKPEQQAKALFEWKDDERLNWHFIPKPRKGLPFKEPSRAVQVFSHFKEQTVDFPLSAPRFYHFRDGQQVFDGFAGENALATTVTGLGDPFQVPVLKTTANYFDVLGLRATQGRTFRPEEEEGADVAVVTERFWKARLGSDPNVIGRAVTLDGV